MITIRTKQVKSQKHWNHKVQGAIFVSKEEDIEPLWKALCEQDDYWEDYKRLIRVAPKEIDNISDLKKYCRYTGKTDIYDVDKLREKFDFDFILYQYDDCIYYDHYDYYGKI